MEHWRQIVSNLSMFDIRNQVALRIFGEDAVGGTFTPADDKRVALDRVLGDLEKQLGA